MAWTRREFVGTGLAAAGGALVGGAMVRIVARPTGEFAGRELPEAEGWNRGRAQTNVQLFGAVGDGRDDTDAIEAAIAASIADGRAVLEFPAPPSGAYGISRRIDLKNARIVGARLRALPLSQDDVLVVSSEPGLEATDLQVDGAGFAVRGIALGRASGEPLTGLRLSNVVVENCYASGSNTRCIELSNIEGGLIAGLTT